MLLFGRTKGVTFLLLCLRKINKQINKMKKKSLEILSNLVCYNGCRIKKMYDIRVSFNIGTLCGLMHLLFKAFKAAKIYIFKREGYQ